MQIRENRQQSLTVSKPPASRDGGKQKYGSRGRTRTYNLWINSPPLCQLSYSGARCADTRPAGQGGCRPEQLPGKGRLSQARRRPVPLALAGVTVLCGMGSGGAPPRDSPGKGRPQTAAAAGVATGIPRGRGSGDAGGMRRRPAGAGRRTGGGQVARPMGVWCAPTVTRCPRPAPSTRSSSGGLHLATRGLIWRTASRLDAVSAYPDPT